MVREGEEGYKGSVWDEGVFERARKATVEVFAKDESASVQVSLKVLFFFRSFPRGQRRDEFGQG